MEDDQQPPAMEPQVQAMGQAIQGLQQQLAHLQQQQQMPPPPLQMNLKVPKFEVSHPKNMNTGQDWPRWSARVTNTPWGRQWQRCSGQ